MSLIGHDTCFKTFMSLSGHLNSNFLIPGILEVTWHIGRKKIKEEI